MVASLWKLFNVHIQSFRQPSVQGRATSYRETIAPLFKGQAILIKPRSIQRVFEREEIKIIYLSNQVKHFTKTLQLE